MEWIVPLSDLDYGAEEEQAVLGVLRTRWLTMGAMTREFENQFAQSLGVKHALTVSNATQALHLAGLALGIGPGDEVIVPSLTFVATANAVLYTGAEVRFADILGPEEPTISAAEIEKQITPRTRAIVVMHYAGFPCQMEEIIAVASRYNLAVIEDAAHAPGAMLSGRALGTWGDAGCFSFFSNKNLSTGEGGMLVTDRDEIAEKVRLLRSHGMTSLTWDRHQGQAYSYDVVDLGYNYRIDEIRSALGLVQLRKLTQNNQRRKEITRLYWRAFEKSEAGLPFYASMENITSQPAYHLFPMLLPENIDRQQFITRLQAAGIQTSIHYPSVHRFRYYAERYPGIVLPKTEDVSRREITLPLYPTMSDDQVALVIEKVLTELS